MNYWTIQNVITLEQCKIEEISEEIWVIEGIKKNYTEAIQKLSLSQFSAFVRILQVIGSNYKRYTISQYYLLLIERLLQDQFIK